MSEAQLPNLKIAKHLHLISTTFAIASITMTFGHSKAEHTTHLPHTSAHSGPTPAPNAPDPTHTSTAKAPATSNPRFAKNDAALDALYSRCAEEQAAIDAADAEADAYVDEQEHKRANQWQPVPQGTPANAKSGGGPIDGWLKWSAKFYAPNLYKNKHGGPQKDNN